MLFKHIFTLLIFSYVCLPLYAQKLSLDGIISGYNYNPFKGIFINGSAALLEGRLNNVFIYPILIIIKSIFHQHILKTTFILT